MASAASFARAPAAHTYTHSVSSCGDVRATVTATCDPAQADAWVEAHVFNSGATHVGFDTESLAMMVVGKPGQPNELALLQLAVNTHAAGVQVLLFQVHAACRCNAPTALPPALRKLLSDAATPKYAIDIRGDVKQLVAECECVPAGMVDLQLLAAEKSGATGSQRISTGNLALTYLQLVLPKDKDKRGGMLSNWSQWPLTAKQVQYATQDAVVALRLAEVMTA